MFYHNENLFYHVRDNYVIKDVVKDSVTSCSQHSLGNL